MKNINLSVTNGLLPHTSTHGERLTSQSYNTTTVGAQNVVHSDVRAKPEINTITNVSDSLMETSPSSQMSSTKENTGRLSGLSKPLAALTPFLRAITKHRTSSSASSDSTTGLRLHATAPGSHERRRYFRGGSAAKNAVFPSKSLRPDVVSLASETSDSISLTDSTPLRPNSKATASQLLALATSKAVKNFRPLLSSHIETSTPQSSFNDNGHSKPGIDVGTTNLSSNSAISQKNALQSSSFSLLEDKNGNLKPNSLQSTPSLLHQELPQKPDHIKSNPSLIPTRPIDRTILSTKDSRLHNPTRAPFAKPRTFHSKLANPNFGLHARSQNHEAFPRTPRICVSKSDYAPPLAPGGGSSVRPQHIAEQQEPTHSSKNAIPGHDSPASSKKQDRRSPPPETPSSTGSRDATFIFSIPSVHSSSTSLHHGDENRSLSSDDVFCPSSGEDSEDVASLSNSQTTRQRRLRRVAPVPSRFKPPPKCPSDPGLRYKLAPPSGDSRRYSSAQLTPPEDVISDRPRRNSVWTAEVLSIEIQVDYNVDPDELWGNKVNVRNNFPVSARLV
ncbi:hypothetical protein RRG08_011285 [Elysia crispata]|uniref:Uncharacterized protein n=1 Tax=Elysia crispata TaxID=231223 RepID=A0AAE1DK33_9GAST|nr:hypothetical protein RRG08_011285 [Elysia crispata]